LFARSLETKEQYAFLGPGLERSETGVAEGSIDAEMLECTGVVEADGEIRRCDGKAVTCGNEIGEDSGGQVAANADTDEFQGRRSASSFDPP
jgi:hypothetical protein